MDTIQVEQAIFASSNRGRIKGYQLVSQSAGVGRESSQELNRWSPTQVLSDQANAWTINSFPLAGDRVAVTRTVLGGPEYSGRGAAQVVTLILLLRKDQFAAYDNNAIAVAKTAMAMGYLRLTIDPECELGQATLPGSPIVDRALTMDSESDDGDQVWLDKASQLLTQSQRIAVVGRANPVDAADRLISRLPVDLRRTFSFTTGLAPAIRRPFQVHFYQNAESKMRRTLDSQEIVLVAADKLPTKLARAT